MIPLGAKVVLSHCWTHYTLHSFFGGLTYCVAFYFCFFCLHNRTDVSISSTTGTGCPSSTNNFNNQWTYMWSALLWLWKLATVGKTCAQLLCIVASEENSSAGWTCSLRCSPWWQWWMLGGFTLREHAVELDGVVVRLFEVNTPEHPNSPCCTLYHRNLSYTLTEIVDKEDWTIVES